MMGEELEPLAERPGYNRPPTEWVRYANHLEAELLSLRQAAWWVVIHWDTESTQHLSMPQLRRALGLPGERPTREEAQARLDEYLRDTAMWRGEAPFPGTLAKPAETPSRGQSGGSG